MMKFVVISLIFLAFIAQKALASQSGIEFGGGEGKRPFTENDLPTQVVQSGEKRSFSVDYTNHRFLKDGQPFRYIAGEIHYFRIHPADWADRLERVRSAGLNAVQVYVPWNFHEEEPGKFNFEGAQNLVQFLRLAQAQELSVLLRIGPYVCAEWEMGLPWWLLRNEGIALRASKDNRYTDAVKRWFDVLLPKLKPLLYANGGPILMLQIENEYGTMGICDKTYMAWLRDLVRGYLGEDMVLYTTDGNTVGYVSCGCIDGVLPTVDFGVQGSAENIARSFELQSNFSGGGPHVNSEFYTMWFSSWGDKTLPKQYPEAIVRSLQWIWAANGSVSLYMVHGGSNFGFWNGAEIEGPVLTSYDYSAPVSEEGQVTPLYLAIRDWIKTLPDWPNPPRNIPEYRSGVSFEVEATPVGNLLSLFNRTVDLKRDCLNLPNGTRPFEALPRFFNLVVHSTIVGVKGTMLTFTELRDFAYIYVDGKFQGRLSSRCGGTSKIPCQFSFGNAIQVGQRLDIIVESFGRLTFPIKTDSEPFKKGILGAITLDNQPLSGGWMQCGLDVDKVYTLAKQKIKLRKQFSTTKARFAGNAGPMVYAGLFDNPESVDWTETHTFFDSRDWPKGVLLVNGFNVGRYWGERGPQMTHFVPGGVFRERKNTAVVIEFHGEDSKIGQREEGRTISFVDKPIYRVEAEQEEENEPLPRQGRIFENKESNL